MNKETCMFLEDSDFENNRLFLRFKAAKPNDIIVKKFCWRLAKGLIYRLWNHEKTEYVDAIVQHSYTNLLDVSKNLIEMKIQ